MGQANAARWRERCEREFQALRKERLASAELECQKLINAVAAHLTQVCMECLDPKPLLECRNLMYMLRSRTWHRRGADCSAAARPAPGGVHCIFSLFCSGF